MRTITLTTILVVSSFFFQTTKQSDALELIRMDAGLISVLRPELKSQVTDYVHKQANP